jgi:hypothetical protein
MLNPEFEKVVDGQISEIFKVAFASEARFRECDRLIQTAKIAFQKVPELRVIDGPDSPSKFKFGFSLINNSTNSMYDIVYHRNFSINPEERLTIVKNKTEKIKLITYKYSDGRYNAFAEFYEDAPEFTNLQSTDFDINMQSAERIIGELTNFL